jgi:hypothetical protein
MLPEATKSKVRFIRGLEDPQVVALEDELGTELFEHFGNLVEEDDDIGAVKSTNKKYDGVDLKANLY